MKIRVWLRVLALAVLLGVLVVGGFLGVRILARPNSRVLMLPGEIRFELIGVSKSGEEFTSEQAWQRVLRRILPGALSAKLPQAFTSRSSDGNTNTIRLWFTLTDAMAANVTTGPWQWYVAVDADGFSYPLNGGSGSSTSGGKTYHHLDLAAFPRRQKDFELRLLDGARQQVAALRLANPAPGPHPNWAAEALPITQTNGPLAVTLERLQEKGQDYSFWLNAKWKIAHAEPEWRNAKPAYPMYEDATGNRGGRLSFAEPAWKITMPFHRVGWSNFTATEKFRLTGLPVPEAGEMQLLQTNFSCAGVGISVQALVGEGTLCITNGTNYAMTSSLPRSGWGRSSDGTTTVESISGMLPFFLIKTDSLPDADEVRFRVVGGDGKEIPVQDNGWSGTGDGGRRYQKLFDVTNAVDSVSLEVIVSRPRIFEFMVNPAAVQRVEVAPAGKL